MPVESFLVDLYSYLLSFFKGLLCVCLFTISYRKRKYFWLRLCASVLGGVFLCCLCTFFKLPFDNETASLAIFTRIVTFSLINCYLFGIIVFCFRENYSESLLCWCMAIAISQAVGKGFGVILNFFGIDDRQTISFFGDQSPHWLDMGILIFFHIFCFGIAALLFTKRDKLQANTRTSVFVSLMATVTILVVYVLGSFSRVYEDMSSNPGLTIASKLFMIVCNLSAVSLALGVLRQNKLSTDLIITEQLLYEEKRHYELSKETVEAINMKCHDLKHRLDSFEHKLNEEELQKLKEAIEIYDSNIKTNNQILDTVLYEKQLFCKKNDIRLQCVANGALLSFVSPSHLYSLFGNAIDNAIEAVKQLPQEHRLIDLSVFTQGGTAVIEVSNYFTGECMIEGGLPITTKEDANRHGYGMKSMRYIVEQYGGRLETKVVKDIFLLRAQIPLRVEKRIKTDS